MTIKDVLRVALVAAPFACLATEAGAQTRTFGCENGRAVTITVTGPNSISARPIDGATMSLRSRGPNDFRFINGDYLIAISPDQRSLKAEIPDWGSATCRAQRQGAAPNQPGLGNADPCGPGFQQGRNGRCERRPGMTQAPAPAPAQKRPDDPCPANFIQAPETDRCDPMSGAPAPRASTNPGKFPMPGRSLGGILRAGPTQSSAKVASTGEGNELTILGRGPMWDGYNWFRVSYQGRTGYQWGGIMCSQNPIAGIHQQCAP